MWHLSHPQLSSSAPATTGEAGSSEICLSRRPSGHTLRVEPTEKSCLLFRSRQNKPDMRFPCFNHLCNRRHRPSPELFPSCKRDTPDPLKQQLPSPSSLPLPLYEFHSCRESGVIQCVCACACMCVRVCERLAYFT